MLRRRKAKLVLSVLFVLLAVWVATPEFYIHALLRHDHSNYSVGNDTRVKSQSADDCEFDKYNQPGYFSIFRFISNFIPLKPQNTGKVEELLMRFSRITAGATYLQAPSVNG